MKSALQTRCPVCLLHMPIEAEAVYEQVPCAHCGQTFRVEIVSAAETLGPQAIQETIDHAAKPSLPPRLARPRAESPSASAPKANSSSTKLSPETSSPQVSGVESTVALVGRFELKRKLGAGGFAVVWRAYDPLLERFVALKLPRIQGGSQTHLRRFVNEAKAAAKLRHPNIVAVFESGTVDNRLFLASELVIGQPLSERLENRPPDRRSAVSWVRDLATALDYAHAEGIVHRDIKPHNIMVDERDRPQIMDFGLARLNKDASMTVEGSLLGTPAYMSPEQARGDMQAIGPASDQYSLGVVLYEMLTGRKPFSGEPYTVIAQVISQEPPPPRTIDDSIPRDLEAICLRAMHRDPARRYASAGDLAVDLTRWLDGQPIAARQIRWVERAWKWSRRNPLAAASVSAVVVVTVGALAVVTAALSESVRARNDEQQARLAANQHQHRAEIERDNARLQATNLAKTNSELATAKAEVEQERQKLRLAVAEAEKNFQEAEAARKLEQQRRIELDKTIQQLGIAEGKAISTAELAKQAEQRARQNEALTRLELARGNLDKGVKLIAKGQSIAGLHVLAKALEEVPKKFSAEADNLEGVLRMSIGSELSSLPKLERWYDFRLPVLDVQPNATNGVSSPTSLVALTASGNVCVADLARPHLEPAAYLPRLGVGNQVRCGILNYADAAHEPGNATIHIGVGYADNPVVLSSLNLKYRESGAIQASTTYQHSLPFGPLFRAEAMYRWCDPMRSNHVTKAVLGSLENNYFVHLEHSDITNPDEKPTSYSQLLPARPVAFAFCNDPKRMLVASEHELRLLDLTKRKEEKTAHISLAVRPNFVAFGSDRGGVAVSAYDRTLFLSYPDLKAQDKQLSHGAPVTLGLFSPAAQSFATIDADRRLAIWDTASHEPLLHESLVPTNYRTMRSIDDNHLLCVGETDAQIWHFPWGKELTGTNDSNLKEYVPVDAPVTHAAIGEDARNAFVAKEKRLAELAVGRTGVLLHPATLPINQVAMTSDETQQVVAVASSNGIWRWTRPVNPGVPRPWTTAPPLRDEDKTTITALACAPGNSRLVLSGNNEGKLILWDAIDRVPKVKITSEACPITGVAIDKDERWLAAANEKLVHLFDWNTKERLRTFSLPSQVTSFVISPSGRQLAVGGKFGHVSVWSIDQEQQSSAIMEVDAPVTALTFLPGEQYVAVAVGSRIRFLHIESGKVAGEFGPQRGLHQAVAFNYGGTHALLMNRVWELPKPVSDSPQMVKQLVCKQTATRLDEAEEVVSLTAREWLGIGPPE